MTMRTFIVTTKTEHAADVLKELAANDELTIKSERDGENDELFVSEPKIDFVGKFWGKLSAEGGRLLDEQLTQSRKEWD